MKLRLSPYTPVEDIQDKKLEIELKKTDFSLVTFKPGTSALVFSFCVFEKILIINDEDIPFEYIDISFIDCYIGSIEIKNIKSNNIGITFVQAIIQHGVLRNKNLSNVSIINSIAESLFIDGAESVYISYSNSNIYPLRWRKLLRKTGNRSGFDKILTIKNSYYLEDIRKINVIGDESKNDAYGIFKSPMARDKEMRYHFRLRPEEIGGMNINLSVTYGNSHIETTVQKMYLNTLSMKGDPGGTLAIEECGINRLFLHELQPKGEMNFYYINTIQKRIKTIHTADTKIEIKSCDLENSWFDNFDFDAYNTISLFRTKFSKTIFSACNFPDDYRKFKSLENVHYPDRLKDNYHKDMYEIFLQLRKALESTGNFEESLKLHAVSNDALSELKNLPSWDKVILQINRLSNNHGTSAQRAFWGFLISSVFAYILYLCSLGKISICKDFDPNMIGYYFSFIDPTHRSDFLVDKKAFGAFTLAFDFVGKLLVGFYIYQFIAAFRKYGKK